jgi:hypothetical protein
VNRLLVFHGNSWKCHRFGPRKKPDFQCRILSHPLIETRHSSAHPPARDPPATNRLLGQLARCQVAAGYVLLLIRVWRGYVAPDRQECLPYLANGPAAKQSKVLCAPAQIKSNRGFCVQGFFHSGTALSVLSWAHCQGKIRSRGRSLGVKKWENGLATSFLSPLTIHPKRNHQIWCSHGRCQNDRYRRRLNCHQDLPSGSAETEAAGGLAETKIKLAQARNYFDKNGG